MKYIINLNHLKAARMFALNPEIGQISLLARVWFDGNYFEASNNHFAIRIKAHEFTGEEGKREPLDKPLFIHNDLIDTIKINKNNKFNLCTITVGDGVFAIGDNVCSAGTDTGRLMGYFADCLPRPDLDRMIFNPPSVLLKNHAEGPAMIGISPEYIGLFEKVNKLIGVKGGIIMSVQANENLPVIIKPISGDCYKAGIMRIRLQPTTHHERNTP